eukprot:SAG31_NODE_25490_length_460_cov_0.786704_1_plen_48_part_10
MTNIEYRIPTNISDRCPGTQKAFLEELFPTTQPAGGTEELKEPFAALA